MFCKCSLDVPNIVTLREHSANNPGILRAGWEMTQKMCDKAFNSSHSTVKYVPDQFKTQ